MSMLLAVLKLAAAIGLLGAAWIVRAPFLAPQRPWFWLAITATAALLTWALFVDRRRRPDDARHLTRLALGVSVIALGTAVWVEGRFQYQRWRVLTASPTVLERAGAHVMIGYTDSAEVYRLLERRAIGGVFVTRRNAVGKTVEALRAEIDGFQEVRRRQGMLPLWVATDQEGGGVSRLSPPLTRLPVLSTLLRGVERPDQLDEQRLNAIDSYADTHGRELASVGVNLNFAPVVDIDHGVRNPNDAYSRIGERAISGNPQVVAVVAQRYCDGLARHGVRCTLKHFPGLGRVFEDTHVTAGRLDTPIAELKATDWVPFQHVGGRGGHFAMVGHVQLGELGLASVSGSVLAQLRPIWRGPVITDDICMGPTYRHWRGVGWSGWRAIRSGIDMVLISWDGEQVYPVLSALIDYFNHAEGDDYSNLGESRRRLRAALPIPSAPPAPPQSAQ